MKKPNCAIAIGHLAIGVLLALTPMTVTAQSGLHFDVTPFISAEGNRGVISMVPEGSDSRHVLLTSGRTLGLGVQMTVQDLPLSVRAGVAYARGTLSLTLRPEDLLERVRAGGAQKRFLVDVLGSASVRSLWSDVIVEPFSGTVAPYGLLGAAYRHVSYDSLHDPLDPYFGSSDSNWQMRFGVGTNVRLTSRSTLWVEAVRDLSPGESLRVGAYSPTEQTSLLFGVKLRLF